MGGCQFLENNVFNNLFGIGKKAPSMDTLDNSKSNKCLSTIAPAKMSCSVKNVFTFISSINVKSHLVF